MDEFLFSGLILLTLLSFFTAANRMDVVLAWVHNYKGGFCGYKGEHDRAISDLNKAIELNPMNPCEAAVGFRMIP